jgi:hypothetical protein
MKNTAIVFMIFVCTVGILSGAENNVISGDYDGLLFAVSPDAKQVSGYYMNAAGYDEKTDSPKFICEFYFMGKKNGAKYNIKLVTSDGTVVTDGVLTPLSDAVKIRLTEEPGGCWNVVEGLTSKEGAVFSGCIPAKWIEIRLVASPKAYFHSAPDVSKKLKSYVIKGDVLRIYEKKNGWVLAEFAGKKTVKGWIKESDVVK